MHAMIFSHISVLQAGHKQTEKLTTLKPVESLYKQTLKHLTEKPKAVIIAI